MTEKEFDKVYDEYREKENWPAPPTVTNAYRALIGALDDYISAVVESEFKNGFEYAIQKMEKEEKQHDKTKGNDLRVPLYARAM